MSLELTTSSDDRAFRAAVSNVVERARAGDQNAMALITTARENAGRGSRVAAHATKAIRAYCIAHPPDSDTMGSEAVEALAGVRELVQHEGEVKPERLSVGALAALFERGGAVAIDAAAVSLSFAFAMTGDVVRNLAQGVRDSAIARLFVLAAKHPEAQVVRHAPVRLLPVVYAGICIGRARMLQDVRRPTSRISRYAPEAGWELGE